MFSTVHREPVLTWLRLCGVSSDGREVPLLSDNELWPFAANLDLPNSRVLMAESAGPDRRDPDRRHASACALPPAPRYHGAEAPGSR